MNILIFSWKCIKNPKSGGAEIVTYEVAKRWIKKGNSVHLVCSNYDYGKKQLKIVVDEEMGTVNIFCRFGNSTDGMPDSHLFRLVNGKYRWIHTVSVNLTGKPIDYSFTSSPKEKPKE